MKPLPLFLAGWAVLLPAVLVAQNFAPPPSKTPDDATRAAIDARLAKLDRALKTLRQQSVRDPWLAEVQVYYKAASWTLNHNEFFVPTSAPWTLDVLDRGLLRASQLAQGETPWVHHFGQSIVRAYRSRIDGSVQPYAVTWPKDYGRDPRKKWRLDVVLHGRDPSLTEVKFLHQHAGDKPAPKQDFIQLDIFGRGNNAYRWAGETDVFEAINAFVAVEGLLGRGALLDPNRVVLRGFSMGGAGTWHLGLHRPDRWCVLGPGAGFTRTHGYIKNLPAQLPAYQEACLRIYDAVDYAENVFNVPVVAYAGANDPQLQAARTIQERLTKFPERLKVLVAPGLAHQFPPEWQKKAEEAYLVHAAPGKGRPEYPQRVHFVTYTLKYPSCYWVEILGLDHHYDQARVSAQKTEAGFTVEAKNVKALRLGLPEDALQPLVVTIDNQEVKVRPYVSQAGASAVYLQRQEKKWRPVLPQKLATSRLRQPRKAAGLQGPIDDAFMDSFLCVRGTGKPWNPGPQKYTDSVLERFGREWDKYLRGELPVKDDVEVTEEDIAGKHLVLFGDPASNSLIGQALDGLPLTWTAKSITLADGKTYAASEHVPVLIYPSPLNPGRYVVLNTGHTFHEADFRGTNALLYPRLGDYAVLKLKPADNDPLAVETAHAGLFDDDWRFPKP